MVSENILLKKNDLITPAVTSLENIGKIAVIDKNLNSVTAGGFVYIFRPYINNTTLSLVISNFISSSLYQSLMKKITKKSGQAFYNMNKEKLLQLYYPLAPLTEQVRIVDKIGFIEPLLEKYDLVEKKLSALEAEFPEKLKKSILQYAIEGKLVKQDPNDEPASVLLERIKAEKEKLIKEGKIKRDKNESYIYQGDDKNYYEKVGKNSKQIDVPFDSSDNSRWVRLSTICIKIVDGNHNPPKGETLPTKYLMLSSQNINKDVVTNLNACRYLTKEQFEIENKRTNISFNDLLFTSVGTLGRTCVYSGHLNICFQRSVTVITTLINPFYLKMFFDTPSFQFKVYKEATGTAQKGFYLNQLATSFVLIYSSSYQAKLVAKVSNLFKAIQ